MTDRAYNGVIYLVSGVWGASMVLSLIPAADHEPPATLHGVFMAVVGVAFAARSHAEQKATIKRQNDDDGKSDGAHRR